MKPTNEEKENFYKSLVRKPKDVFPINLTREVEFGNVYNRVINGFGY